MNLTRFLLSISNRIIRIPPLRERPGDIVIAAKHSLQILNEKKHRYISIDEEALDYLKNFTWPGNFRQLYGYIKNIYFECIQKDLNLITIDLIKVDPPENKLRIKKEDFDALEEALIYFMSSWDPEDGDFLNGFIHPIIAKIYIEDHQQNNNKTTKFNSASSFLGLDGSRFNKSTLNLAYEKYKELKKTFNL